MDQTDNTPVVELVGVRKLFGSFVAVDGIDLRVDRGQVFGFLGPNGAGKTTTLRLITGLLRPNAGRIMVCGIDALARPRAAKQRIGFISDRPYLYEKLTGGEFLRFVGGLWGMNRADIEQRSGHWMERFDMLGWLGESIESYSHGMRQRLLLCSTLMHNPDLLIMDEPLVGLDPRGANQLKQVVRELAQEHQMSVVLSTHTLEVVEQVCDMVSIIHKGRIVISGTMESVRKAHRAEPERLEEVFLKLTEGEEQEGGR
jgi:ABC-2 type transport system ATP-binding protein